MSTVSVIIPTRNRTEFLRAAVESVLQQTQIDFELLLVNDGSTALPQFADPRVRILENHEAGAVPARNLGVASAHGDYIAFLDDDDAWVARDHLSYALTANCDFFFADGMMKFPNGKSKIFAQDADAKSLEKNNTILISAVVYKKSLHAVLGRFDEQLPYYWDWDWYLRVARTGAAFRRRAEPVVNIQVHAQNMSGASNASERQLNLGSLCAKHGLSNVTLKGHTDFV